MNIDEMDKMDRELTKKWIAQSMKPVYKKPVITPTMKVFVAGFLFGWVVGLATLGLLITG